MNVYDRESLIADLRREQNTLIEKNRTLTAELAAIRKAARDMIGFSRIVQIEGQYEDLMGFEQARDILSHLLAGKGESYE